MRATLVRYAALADHIDLGATYIRKLETKVSTAQATRLPSRPGAHCIYPAPAARAPAVAATRGTNPIGGGTGRMASVTNARTQKGVCALD